MRKALASPMATLAFAVLLGIFAGPTFGLLSARTFLASSSGGDPDDDCPCNCPKGDDQDPDSSDGDDGADANGNPSGDGGAGGGDMADGQDGGGAEDGECSDGPINYATGKMRHLSLDLRSGGFGGWGQRREFVNGPIDARYPVNVCGYGWATRQWPRLIDVGNTVFVVVGGQLSCSFHNNGNGTYTANSFSLNRLTESGGTRTLTDTFGRQSVFSGPASLTPGVITQYLDESLNSTSFVTNSGGQPIQIQRSFTGGGTTTTELWVYNLNLSGSFAGLLSSVVLQRQVNGGAWSTVRQVAYSYYSGSANGPFGSLQRAVIKDAAGNTLRTKYYRYYATGPDGFIGLKYDVSNRAYERLKAAAGGTDALVDTATDGTVATYAGYFYQYDAQNRVSSETVQATGCSCSGAGSRGTFAFSYADSGFASGYNNWKRRTIETLPDGNQKIVYTNYVSEVMLKVFKDVTSGQQWRTYTLFEPGGRVSMRAMPSCVTGHDEAQPGLVTSAFLADNTGLVKKTIYNNGRTWLEYVQQGEIGTAILVKNTDYVFNNSAGVPLVNSVTQYRNTDGTGGQTTTNNYTMSGWAHVQSNLIQFPIVPTSQNGSGVATTMTRNYDVYNRETSQTDEDGFLHTKTYDVASGAVTQKVINSGGLNLTTIYRRDALGRATKITDPNGDNTYVIYKDTTHEKRIYPGWTGTATTGPTRLIRQDWTNSYDERLTMSAAPHVTGVEPDGTEAVSNLQTLMRDYLDTGDRKTNTDSYFSFSGLTYSTAANIGALGTNYYRVVYGYDSKGHRDRTVDWTGTIARQFYDSRDRVSSAWIGTSDTPASGNWSPTNNTAPSNMIRTNQYFYDSPRTAGLADVSGLGDGNMTHSCRLTSASVALDAFLYYDFRNRRTQTTGPDGVSIVSTFDNLDYVTLVQTYAGSVTGANLRSQTRTGFDDKGQVYQSVRYQVDCDTDAVPGQVRDSLTTDFWSNARGLRVKTRGPNGEFTKISYDGAGRQTAMFVCFDDAELNTDYASALTAGTGAAGSDRVVEQAVYAFDADSNVIQTTSYQRCPSSTKTGDLSVSWAAADSRRKYAAQWYDFANRPTASADYGTNGGVALSRPTTPPAPPSGDNISYILTLYGYDDTNHKSTTTDNKSRITQTTYDGLNRVIAIIENGTSDPTATMLDTNRKKSLVYDTVGRLYQRIAYNPKGGTLVEQQITKYVYGTLANQASPPVSRNDILVAEIYPDSDDAGGNGVALGNGGDGTYDRIEYTYDYASRRSTMKDQRQVIHTFTYDSAGRMSADSATSLPSGVDGTVQRIGMSYDTLSRKKQQTSYSDAAGAMVFNQVQYKYGNLGAATQRYDSHVGAVVTASTPSVQVGYTDGGPGTLGGVGKYVRPTSTTYPNARVVYSNYPMAGATSIGDHLSRIDNIAQDSAGTTQFAQYSYMGARKILDITHPQVTNGLVYRQGPENAPGAWDNFDRQIYTKWRNTANSFSHDLWNYTYDSVSNRLTRQNAASTAPATPNDEFYTYDGLRRLTNLNRGKLTGTPLTISNAASNYELNWPALESQGDWRSFQVAPTGAGNFSFQQTRSHNSANEIDVDNNDNLPPGASITNSWIAPTYDKAGNTTTSPVPGNETGGYFLTYDAWNRLVKVQNGTRAAPGTEVVEYQYDAGNWRTVKLVPNGANWNRTDYYHNLKWQCVEERTFTNVAGKTSVATTPSFQWVWDLKYVDAVLFRDVVPINTAQRLYYCQDANQNTTALVNQAGNVVERYLYDAYGKATVLSATWTTQAATVNNNEMLFAGYRKDPETQLYHVRNRTYHSTLGRWVQRDPIGYGDGMDLYQYVRSMPGARVDPLGLGPDNPAVAIWEWGMQQSQGLDPEDAALVLTGTALAVVVVYAGDEFVGGIKDIWSWMTGPTTPPPPPPKPPDPPKPPNPPNPPKPPPGGGAGCDALHAAYKAAEALPSTCFPCDKCPVLLAKIALKTTGLAARAAFVAAGCTNNPTAFDQINERLKGMNVCLTLATAAGCFK